MPGLLDFFSRLWNDYNLIIAIVVIIALNYLWTHFAKSERGLRFAVSTQPKTPRPTITSALFWQGNQHILKKRKRKFVKPLN